MKGSKREEDTCDGAPILNKALLTRPVKVRAVIDSRLRRRGPAEDRRLPRVEMRIEVNDGYGTVRRVYRAQKGQYNGMVPSERDDPRMMLAIDGDGQQGPSGDRVVAQCGEGGSMKELLVTVLNLFNSILVVVWSDGDVATVDNLQPGQKRVYLKGDIIAAVQCESARACADAGWAKASSWPIRCSGIEGCSYESDVESLSLVLRQTLDPGKLRESRDSGKNGVCGHVVVAGVHSLVREADIVQRHLVVIDVA